MKINKFKDDGCFLITMMVVSIIVGTVLSKAKTSNPTVKLIGNGLKFSEDISPSSITTVTLSRNIESIISLNYQNSSGERITGCSLSHLNSIEIITPCSCDNTGICSVGIRGTLNRVGVAGFSYRISSLKRFSKIGRVQIEISLPKVVNPLMKKPRRFIVFNGDNKISISETGLLTYLDSSSSYIKK
jgi:hypothetical protein